MVWTRDETLVDQSDLDFKMKSMPWKLKSALPTKFQDGQNLQAKTWALFSWMLKDFYFWLAFMSYKTTIAREN